MTWQIVTDSSCDMLDFPSNGMEIGFSSVPFSICVDEHEFIDDIMLDHTALMNAMDKSGESHTSCPAPSAWYEEFTRADQTLAITISGKLSGSLQSASIARQMVLENHPEKKIEIIDSLSTGPKLVLIAQRVVELISSGASFERVVTEARLSVSLVKTVFSLSSFQNLVQNGRISNVVSYIAGKLNIRIIGEGSSNGHIKVKHKTRGRINTLKTILNEMETDGFTGGIVAISHCCNEEFAHMLAERIRSKWSNVKIQIMLTRGLCSYYAERDGIILAYRQEIGV